MANEPGASSILQDDEDFETIEQVCGVMTELADELASLDGRIHHIAVDLQAISDTNADMTNFLRKGGSRDAPRAAKLSILTGVEAAKKPFHRLTKMQQFEAVDKILNMRIDVSVRLEALRRARAAARKCVVVKRALAIEPQGLARDPEERKFLIDLLDEQLELNKRTLAVEKERIRLGLETISGKVKVVELLAQCHREVELLRREMGDDDDDDDDDEVQDENQASNSLRQTPTPSRAETLKRRLASKAEILKKEEARATEMKFLIQKLMFSCPNNALTYDESTNLKHKDMMLFCGKTLAQMREEMGYRNVAST